MRVVSCRVRVVSRRCHVQIGLAYLAMEKYESARDAFQLSLKGMTHPSIHSLTLCSWPSSAHEPPMRVCGVCVCVRARAPKT
jgi:hypothetical protein